jgi:4-amino-4-deoxy-L-arabinose transferase-like glycosyltransferase
VTVKGGTPAWKAWRRWGSLFASATLLRALVAFVLLGSMPMVSDARDYFAFALRLAAGDVREAYYWPPGESGFLAAGFAVLGPSVAAARALTVIVSTLTIAFVVLIARHLSGERTARAAGWMWAAYPPSVLLCGQAYAQHLAALCLAAVAYFGMRAASERRPWLFVATALALGCGILTRPSMASLALVVSAAWAVAAYRQPAARRHLAAGAAAAAVVGLACVLPACAHDARSGAGWTVSTNNERNFFLGNNPYTPDYKTSHLGQRSLEELDAETRAYLESFYARPDPRSAMRHAAIDYVVHHPGRTTVRTINRATSFWGFDYLASREIQNWRRWSAARTLPLLALEGASYLAIAALAIVALFALRDAGRPEWRWWLVALALGYELPYAIAFSGGTYHFPVVPLLVPLAAIAATRPTRAWRSFRRTRSAWVALGIFMAIEAQYAYFAIAMRG